MGVCCLIYFFFKINNESATQRAQSYSRYLNNGSVSTSFGTCVTIGTYDTIGTYGTIPGNLKKIFCGFSRTELTYGYKTMLKKYLRRFTMEGQLLRDYEDLMDTANVETANNVVPATGTQRALGSLGEMGPPEPPPLPSDPAPAPAPALTLDEICISC